MEPAFFVSEFSSDILSILIKQCFGADFNDIASKIQVKNVVGQLTELNANTIICEREYIDKDYSDDYANYYVQSFKDYRGSCARLHFFSQGLNQEQFSSYLTDEKNYAFNVENLNLHYLGFIVIKPLPFTFLGRVCIKSPLLGRISRNYHVNLFGIPLSIKSIAFQEQDRVVAACATTAVWSLLHALPEIHNKHIPSPSAITLAAIGSPFQNINSFPNKGLNLAQITTALESLKLRQHSFSISTFDTTESKFLRKFTECYVNSKIPVFLGAQIYKRVASNSSKLANNVKYEIHGDHAIVVVGIIRTNYNYSLIVHDDRLGPFIQIDLIPVKLNSKNTYVKNNKYREGAESLFAFEIKGENELLVPNAVLVATYSKKKIGVEPIIETATLLLETFRKEYLSGRGLPELYLEFGRGLRSTSLLYECHELKTDYFKTKRTVDIQNVLVSHLPHFIWQIRYFLADKPIVDFLFDATDTPNGTPYIQYVVIDNEIGSYFINGLKVIANSLREHNVVDEFWQIINEKHLNTYHFDILRKIAPTSLTHKEFLSSSYGELRSPYYLKNRKFALYAVHVIPGDSGQRCRLYSSLDVAAFNFDLLEFVSSQQSQIQPLPPIWVIDEEGALIIGPDTGHPNLTGANPARIAGEIKVSECKSYFVINANSGRYSKQYAKQDISRFLENAKLMWKSVFPDKEFRILQDN
jgi:hypothetical protein